MSNLKLGFARYMAGFHRYFTPTTKATTEWAARPLETAVVYAPGRMIDSVDDILASWRRNDNSGEYGVSSHLPVALVAMAKDYVPIMGDRGRQIADDALVMFPDDAKERVFRLRQIHGERRAQVVFAASEEVSARSMAMQFCLYLTAVESRSFFVPYKFAGLVHEWPCMLETPDVQVMSHDTGQKNLTVLSVDLNLHESIPLFSGPKAGERGDGKGTDGDPDDPHGIGSNVVEYEKNQIILLRSGEHG